MDGDTSGPDDKSYFARDYQVQLLSIAEKENTIIFLPTGSGKTFVAVMLVKAMSRALEKPYNEGGKRTFFAVNTVALVTQQGDYLARHTHLTIGKYSGDMNVDTWDANKWQNELKKYQVIVLTCQILLDMLQHGFVLLENINLIIFDECHHAVADHCMRRVMQTFEKCPKDMQPRVLGLSATLLNANCKAMQVQNEIEKLETTFQARVATVDDIRQVRRFSTRPKEETIKFEDGYPASAPDGILSLQADVFNELQAARELLSSIDPGIFSLNGNVGPPPSSSLGYAYRMTLSPNERHKKKLMAIVNDVGVMVDDLGIFGGHYATLYAIVFLHRKKLAMNTPEGKLVISALITHMTIIRKLISDKLDVLNPIDQVLKFSTNKVLALIELIREYENPLSENPDLTIQHLLENKKEALGIKPCALIFVERRQAAKTLYQILKHMSEHCENLKSVQPEFVVGISSSPISMESALKNKRHHDAIKKFRSGECNYLVASDVMEEGVDIPLCSLVVKLDLPKTFRSYVQSKGRARHSSSRFVMLIPESKTKFLTNLREFREVESVLKQFLVGKTNEREGPSEEDVYQNLYAQDIPPYSSEDFSATVSLTSAVPLINRYCSVLPQDKFTQLYPYWVLEGGSNEPSPVRHRLSFQKPVHRTIAYLQFPINAPVRNIIKGLPMPNKRLAKRAVALIACVLLHRRGELGKNDLLPVRHDPEILDDASIFPNWIEKEDVDGIPGTKKLKRLYHKEVAKVLTKCNPVPGTPTYVYHIIQKPVYGSPSRRDSRGTAIFNVLSMERGFAILSSKKLPQVCDFSVFMSSGEIDVKIKQEPLKEEVTLSPEEIKDLEKFHCMLFLDLLKICKQFVVVDRNKSSDAYLIAPTCKEDSTGKWIIDWDIVRNFPLLPPLKKPLEEEEAKLQVDDESFLYKVVAPWYRGCYIDHHYIVTKVCEEMNAESSFPSTKYTSFEEYFQEKYDLTLVHPKKPLLEVKGISSCIDCIHPKGVSEPFDDTPPILPLSKRQMQLKQGDFLEHLIPELVTKRHLPSTLWLKASTLPTVLHRFSCMQLANELRNQIIIETNMTSCGPPEGRTWRRLEVELNEVPRDVQGKKLPVPVEFFMESNTVQTLDEEPPDLDHDINSVCLMDVVQYYQIEVKQNEDREVHHFECSAIKPTPIPQNVLNRIQGMSIPDHKNCQGPELADVLSALTGASSSDVFNLERLETLGDSFLKFASSTFLYLKYPMMDEGKLTAIKGKMISNRNLFYCAKSKNLGGKIKVHPFAPSSDWIPPGFTVPAFLKEKLDSHGGITKNILFQLAIPDSERRSGRLSRDTMNDILSSLSESQTNNTIGTMSPTLEALLGMQSVPDKSVADCVEAMLGAWLVTGGSVAALSLLGWFGIFPHGDNGPAGSWEELLGAELLDVGKKKEGRHQDEYGIIGGVVDWGPDADANSTRLSNEIDDLSSFMVTEMSSEQTFEYNAVNQEMCGERCDPIKEVGNNLTVEESRNAVPSGKPELHSDRYKRRKLSHSSSELHQSEVELLSVEDCNNKEHPELGDTVDDLNNYCTHLSSNETVKRNLTDFEVNNCRVKETVEETIDALLPGAKKLEACINYEFKNKSLLLQAVTHASYYPNRLTECYQRLEFLGDAVLDFVITCHIYETCGKLSPGQLTDLRSSLVNNITFASLVVRYGLHRHLLHLSPSLMEVIDTFVEFQFQRGNAVTEDCLVLMEEDECYIAESVEVPKALGDIFESLAGAIFLDSGLSLKAVWEVFYPMMKNEIEAFSKKVPKQPVRELLETDADVRFMPSEEVQATISSNEVLQPGPSKKIVMVPVKVIEKGSKKERTFHGFGERKVLAKRAAAKLALRAMGKGTKPQ